MDDQHWVGDLISVSEALHLDPDQVLDTLVGDWIADLLTTGSIATREVLLSIR